MPVTIKSSRTLRVGLVGFLMLVTLVSSIGIQFGAVEGIGMEDTGLEMNERFMTSSTPLNDFNYRKSLMIEGVSGTGIGYHLKVEVHYGDEPVQGDGYPNPESVYLNGHCQEVFDDIRFADDDGVTELTHWKTRYTSGDMAIFWVKVNDDLSNDQKIFIYYGNGQASDTSAPNNMDFIVWDDFDNGYSVEDTPMASRGWSSTGKDGSDVWEIANNPTGRDGMGMRMREDSAGGDGMCIFNSWTQVSYDIAVHYDFYWENRARQFGMVVMDVDDWYPYSHLYSMSSASYDWQYRYDGSWWDFQNNLEPSDDTWYDLSYGVEDATDGTALLTIDGTPYAGNVGRAGDGWDTCRFCLHDDYSDDVYIENFFVRRYNPAGDPTHSLWGAEEGVNPPVLAQGSYYKSHTINSRTGAGTFYQVSIDVRRGTGPTNDGNRIYLMDRCSDFPNDVFFISGDKKVKLDHWISWSDADRAIIWVELSDSLETAQTIYTCYGGDVGISDGEKTFIAFDDFEDYNNNDDLDIDKGWIVQGASGGDTIEVRTNPWDTSEKVLYHDEDGSGGDVLQVWNIWDRVTHDVSVNFKLRWVDQQCQFRFYVMDEDWYPNAQIKSSKFVDNHEWRYVKGDGSWQEFSNGWGPHDYRWDDLEFKMDMDGTPTFSMNSQAYSADNRYDGDGWDRIRFYAHDDYEDAFYIDDYYVRKCINSEPTHGVWGEEVQIIYHEDCSDLSTWNYPNHRETSCHDWAFPIMKDIEGAGTLACPSPDPVYFDIDNLDIGQISPMWHWEIGTPFKLSKLHEFRLDVEICPTSISEKGELHIALFSDNDILTSPFDDTPHGKPIVDIVFSDDTISDHSVSVRGLYYDEMLIEYTSDTLVDVNDYLKCEFIVELDDEGNLILTAEGIGAVVIAPWTVVNTERIVKHVGFQVKSDTLSCPSLRIHDILVSQYSIGHEDLELAYGNEPLPMAQMFRSAPKHPFLELREPRPATEIQVFPENGKLYFSFTHHVVSSIAWICLDIRLISGSSPQDIELFHFHSQWGNWASRGSQSLTYDFVDPGPPTANFIREWTFNPVNPGENKIMIDVGLQTDCIIALRGIWVLTPFVYHYDVVQLFDSSNDYELEYLIPMGPNTKIDFEWGGDPNAHVDPFIDGHPIIGSYGYPRQFYPDFEYNDVVLDVQLPDYTTSNDFVRNNLHRLKLKYTGSSSSAFVKTMHVNYLWVNIEYDWVKYNGVEYDPIDLVNFPYLTDYYRDHTHGRIEIHRGSYINSPSAVLSDVDLCELGNNGHYGHVGDRYWIWTVYQTDSAPGGLKISTAALAYDGQDYYNGWKQWTAMWVQYHWEIILPGWISWMTAATLHEWGHIAHNHEGYIDRPWQGENCEHSFCVYHDGDIFPNSLICAFHGHQTWYNVNDYYANWPWHWEHEWYML